MKSSTLVAVIIMSMLSSQVVVATVGETILADYFHDHFVTEYAVLDPIVIRSDDDFASQAWPGSGTPEDPYVIEGYSIEGAYLKSCIEIANTRVHFTVSNCFLYGAEGSLWGGLSLTNVTNGLIQQNNFTQNENGIFLRRSQNNTIRNNELYANEGRGIYLSESDNNTLTGNDILDNYSDGIHVFQSNWVSILNNTCNQNFGDGIYVSGGLDIYFHDSKVANNTCKGNIGSGIKVFWGASSVVTNNTCSDNSDGLYIGSSALIFVTENVFIENSDGISLAMSTGISVMWNALIDNERNGYEMGTTSANLFDYNFWSDYSGNDSDGDGIGDTPYYDIVGGEPPSVIYGNIVDNHPLMYWPWHEPTTTTTTTTAATPTTATTTTTAFGMPFEMTILLALGIVGSLVVVVLFFIWIRKPGERISQEFSF